jgi:hypothetical protein
LFFKRGKNEKRCKVAGDRFPLNRGIWANDDRRGKGSPRCWLSNFDSKAPFFKQIFNALSSLATSLSQMATPLTAFRQTVFGAHRKTPWAVRLQDTLNFVSAHPEYTLDIGLIPAGPNGFFLDSTLFAEFLGLKNQNSCNRNFQQHGFPIDRRCNVAIELPKYYSQSVPSGRHWAKRVFTFGAFNGDATGMATNYARDVRMSRAPIAAQPPIAQEAVESEGELAHPSPDPEDTPPTWHLEKWNEWDDWLGKSDGDAESDRPFRRWCR